MSDLSTPVVLIIFKRPDTTRRVFDVIRQARPRQLFVIADGPRTPEEAPRCEAARAIIDTVDWDCDVLKNYAETNLGLKRRVSSGIDWVFSQVEESIILEDDCLPDITFFRFCQELLDYYRDEPRVMQIGGSHFVRRDIALDRSYYLSRYPFIWGWATWRRAWDLYDVDMSQWSNPAIRAQTLAQFGDRHERNFWRYHWNRTFTGRIMSWDFQWSFACLSNRGLTALPGQNLISNIGVGSDATNTHLNTWFNSLPTAPMGFPLRHPDQLERHAALDHHAASVRLLNPPTDNFWLDAARSLFKHIKWQCS